MLRGLLIGITAVTMGSGLVTLPSGTASAKRMESGEILFKKFKSAASTARSYNNKGKLCATPRRQMCTTTFKDLVRAKEALDALVKEAKKGPHRRKMESGEILFKKFKSAASTARSYNNKGKLCATPRRQMCTTTFKDLVRAKEALDALNQQAKTAP